MASRGGSGEETRAEPGVLEREDLLASAPQLAVPEPPPGAAGQQRVAIDPKAFKKWTTLYAVYFDPQASAEKGRRLPLHKLEGCSDPWPGEVGEAAARLGFKVVLEQGKRHPCESLTMFPQQTARVRVELKGADGAPVRPDVAANKAQLLLKVAQLLPMTQARVQRLQYFAQQRAMMARQLAEQAAAAAAQKAASAAKPGKGGKGKR